MTDLAVSAKPPRVRVRSTGDGGYEVDRRDGAGWSAVTREEYDAVVGRADACPFCETDDDAEECPW